MALCTQCGAVFHDDEINDHVCDEADIPKKGEKHQPKYDKKSIDLEVIE